MPPPTRPRGRSGDGGLAFPAGGAQDADGEGQHQQHERRHGRLLRTTSASPETDGPLGPANSAMWRNPLPCFRCGGRRGRKADLWAPGELSAATASGCAPVDRLAMPRSRVLADARARGRVLTR